MGDDKAAFAAWAAANLGLGETDKTSAVKKPPASQVKKRGLSQRDMNRRALEFAIGQLHDGDASFIFGDDVGDGSARDEEVLEKAKANAIRRIRSLLPKE